MGNTTLTPASLRTEIFEIYIDTTILFGAYYSHHEQLDSSMPYGRPSPSGHGCRPTRYRWTPSFDPVSPRRRRRRKFSRPARRQRPLPASPSRDWNETLQWALAGRPCPNWVISILAYGLIIDLIIFFPPLIAVFILNWVTEHRYEWTGAAEEETLSAMEEVNRALRITRKTSVDGPPSPDEIRAAWAASRRSLEGKLLAGTLLSNLEPVVDQSYIRDEDGMIVGRRAGIKGWLEENCPDMLPRYKALMSYKALADKLRMALGVEEPDTLSGVLDFGTGTAERTTETTGTMETMGTARTPETVETSQTTEGRNEKKSGKRVYGRSGEPKSLRVRKDLRFLKSNEKNVVSRVYELNAEMARRGGAWTKASLEAMLREQLGLVWMRRTRSRLRAA